MYGIIFVRFLRVRTLCVYDTVLDTLFHMYSIIFVNSLRDDALCVYDIVLDTLFHMYEPHWLTFYDLNWWKVSSTKFLILTKIVRDVLAILISTVASESAFSIGRRVLDHFRSSLALVTVEVLICSQN
jgi:hypothetical protein